MLIIHFYSSVKILLTNRWNWEDVLNSQSLKCIRNYWMEVDWRSINIENSKLVNVNSLCTRWQTIEALSEKIKMPNTQPRRKQPTDLIGEDLQMQIPEPGIQVVLSQIELQHPCLWSYGCNELCEIFWSRLCRNGAGRWDEKQSRWYPDFR